MSKLGISTGKGFHNKVPFAENAENADNATNAEHVLLEFKTHDKKMQSNKSTDAVTLEYNKLYVFAIKSLTSSATLIIYTAAGSGYAYSNFSNYIAWANVSGSIQAINCYLYLMFDPQTKQCSIMAKNIDTGEAVNFELDVGLVSYVSLN